MQVKNKFFSYLFNTLDVPVRFIYSHAPVIRKLLYKKLYSSNYKALDNKFEYFKSIFEKNNIELKNKIILEIGPGNSLIMAYNFLLNGAQKVILVDKYPLNAFAISTYKNKSKNFKTEALQKQYFKEEQNFIKEKYGEKHTEKLFEEIKANSRIEYIASDLSEIKSLEPIDIITSNSVFEHIKNPEETIKASSNFLKPGAYALHSIDLRDHYNFQRPFLFYKYSDQFWEKYLTKLGVSYTNRLRYDEFIDKFKEAGFKTMYEKRSELKLKEKRLNNKFKNRNDLTIAQVDLLLQK